MPPSKKRKAVTLDHADEAPPGQRVPGEEEIPGEAEAATPSAGKESREEPSGDDGSAKDNAEALRSQERKEKFRALQARAVSIPSLHLAISL